MKKKLILFILILILILIIIPIIIGIKLIHNNQNHIQYYKIDRDNIESISSQNDNIYYLTKDTDKYTLYINNITTKQEKKIGDIVTSEMCYAYNYYISCIYDNKEEIYDYNLNKLYEGNDIVVYFQDNIVTLKDNSLYKNNEMYRELPEILQNCYISYYVVIDNNTYMLFSNFEDNTNYIYDILNNNYKKVDGKVPDRYDSGFYIYDKETIKIIDMRNNITKEFPNKLDKEYLYPLTINNNTIYYGDTNLIKVYNYKKDKISIIDISNDPYLSLNIYNNKLYATVSGDKYGVYVIDIDNIKLKYRTMKQYKKDEDNKIKKKVTSLEEQYGVKIITKDDAVIDNSNYKAEVELNNQVINEGLKSIEETLKKFNNTFFKEFNISLYLASSIHNIDPELETLAPNSFTDNTDNEYKVVIDINTGIVNKSLCHEIMYILENNSHNQDFLKDWNSHNPKNFIYGNIYNDYMYATYETTSDNVYFVDNFSYASSSEDKAIIFENICGYEDSPINYYPHLYQKGLYLKKELLNEYPNLKNTTIFNSLKEKE